MKKLLLTVTLIVLTLCLFSCTGEVFDGVVAQLDELYWQSSSLYTEDQINQIENSFEQFGLNITGEVLNIAHYVKPSYPESIWVYVYEFESDADAKAFKENYADNWGNAKISGTIVIYGNDNEIINSITL